MTSAARPVATRSPTSLYSAALVLVLDDLRKRRGQTQALDGVSLRVEAGEIVGLLGPNGAGKSTLVSIAAGLIQPDSGGVQLGRAGEAGSPTLPRIRRDIGLAPQSLAIYDELSGAENLAFFAGLSGVARRDIPARVDAALAFVGLEGRRDDRAKTYSGGMARRLNLAAALVHQPEVLFLDEPTTGLDPRARNELWVVLDSLVGSGTTILLTTQYLEEADRLSDDIVVVDHGHVIARGDARSLKRQVGGDNIGVTVADVATLDDVCAVLARVTGADPVVDRVARTVTAPTTAGVAGLADVANALAASGQQVEDLSLRQPTLDEVFLTLTGSPVDEPDAAQEVVR